jgi:hypothetical protein
MFRLDATIRYFCFLALSVSEWLCCRVGGKNKYANTKQSIWIVMARGHPDLEEVGGGIRKESNVGPRSSSECKARTALVLAYLFLLATLQHNQTKAPHDGVKPKHVLLKEKRSNVHIKIKLHLRR